jgi:hypothetical protein|tara:strand:+ start:631 stop:888 length:258 start_codon:yes stop_codon:yes gene_type:complete
MTPITVTAETRRISGIMEDACEKLMEYSEFLRSKNKVSGVLDEFQATQVICDSMSGDMTFEDLDAMDEPDIFYMCLDELRALSNN